MDSDIYLKLIKDEHFAKNCIKVHPLKYYILYIK